MNNIWKWHVPLMPINDMVMWIWCKILERLLVFCCFIRQQWGGGCGEEKEKDDAIGGLF